MKYLGLLLTRASHTDELYDNNIHMLYINLNFIIEIKSNLKDSLTF